MELFFDNFLHFQAKIIQPNFYLGVYCNLKHTQFNDFIVGWAFKILQASNYVLLVGSFGIRWVGVEFKLLNTLENLTNVLVDGLGVLRLTDDFEQVFI